MHHSKFFLAMGLVLALPNAHGVGLTPSKSDCVDILERWAADPSSVSQQLVDTCKDLLAADADVERAVGAESLAMVDPCAGPDAANSVYCWGPWSNLAPAAGGVAPVQLAAIEEPTVDPEFAQEFDRTVIEEEEPVPPVPEPPLPLGSCQPGSPCGFATVVAGVTGQGDSEDTAIERFDMAQDGSEFTVDPGGENEIASVKGMETNFTTRPDEYENMLATGISGDERSLLLARVIRNGDRIEKAADFWGDGNAVTRDANSGFFAWGIASSQATLDALNNTGGGVSVAFSGPMSVNNSTNASMVINFGTQPTWTGNWTNPGYAFGAGGSVRGVDLISDSAQFTSNVQADTSVVQGVLLGEQGAQAIAHIVDVELNGIGRIKDVGLLQQAP